MRVLAPVLLICIVLLLVVLPGLFDEGASAAGPAVRPAAPSPELSDGADLGSKETIELGAEPEATRATVARGDSTWNTAVTGTVADEGGEPLEGVALRLARADGLGHTHRLATDGDGAFLLEGLEPADDWVLVADLTDHRPARTEPFRIAEGRPVRHALVLRRDYALSGRVVDAVTAEPVAGARLVLADPFAAPGAAVVQTLVTDGTGAFRFEDVGAGVRELVCRAEGYGLEAVRYLRFSADDDVHQSRDLALVAGRSISGRVVDPAGRGLVGVEVEGYGEFTSSQAMTDAGGWFRLDALSEELYFLEAEGPGWVVVVGEVDTDTTDTVVEAVETGTVVGRVRAGSGEPVERFRVVLREAHPSDLLYGRPVVAREFEAGPDGRFEFRGVGEGDYFLVASADAHAPAFSDRFHVVPGRETAEVELSLGAGAALEGRVVGAESGEPLVGARVELSTDGWEPGRFAATMGFESGLTELTLETDAEGRFRAEGLVPGTYQVRARHPERYELVRRGLVVDEGDALELEALALERPAVLEGTVVAIDGSAAAEVSVFALPASRDLSREVHVTTDGEGRFRLPLPPGEFVVWAVRPPKERPKSADLEVAVVVHPGESRELRLQLGGL